MIVNVQNLAVLFKLALIYFSFLTFNLDPLSLLV